MRLGSMFTPMATPASFRPTMVPTMPGAPWPTNVRSARPVESCGRWTRSHAVSWKTFAVGNMKSLPKKCRPPAASPEREKALQPMGVRSSPGCTPRSAKSVPV